VRVDAVLLDLDGTLVDTAPDLVRVLNTMLVDARLPRMPYAVARNVASNGALGLLRLGFGAGMPQDRLDELRARFLEIYARNVSAGSKVFMDISKLCEAERDILWGIVTNKPDALTVPLLAALGIDRFCACVVSGDRLPQRKPHPAPLRHAAAALGVDAAHCIYVGDAPRDIEAGRAAGMSTIAAAYGYIPPRENVAQWGADAVIRRPNELLDALRALRARPNR
jgi:N-acetyl-D-muramate 6-phosphate phosphatase